MKNMKNLKLFGLAFAVCGLALVASCSKDDDNNADDNGNGSGTVTLAAPAGLTVGEVTLTTADLSWGVSEGATSYELKVGENASSTFTATSYTVTGLTPATTYTWQVRAKNAETYSAWASSTFTTAVPEALDVPTGLNVTNIERNTADFSWTGSASSYELQWGGNEFNDPVVVAATSHTVESLLPGKLYSWRVRAKSAETFSEWANGDPFLTTPNPTQRGAQVRFGTYTWSAAVYRAIVDFEDPYTGVELYSSDPNSWTNGPEYPFFQFYVAGNTADDYSDANGYSPSYEYDVDYYHQSYLNIGDEEEPWITGDYWMDSDFPSSIEITEINAEKISGTVNLTLIDMITFISSDYETVINVPLTVYFFNIPVTDYADLGAGSVGAPAAAKAATSTLTPGKYPLKLGKNQKGTLKTLKARR
jgi:hypothetical protein